MLTTKRYEYLGFDKIGFHPILNNHRALNTAKVTHLEKDILGMMEFKPRISPQLKTMDSALFQPRWGQLKDLLKDGKPARKK